MIPDLIPLLGLSVLVRKKQESILPHVWIARRQDYCVHFVTIKRKGC